MSSVASGSISRRRERTRDAVALFLIRDDDGDAGGVDDHDRRVGGEAGRAGSSAAAEAPRDAAGARADETVRRPARARSRDFELRPGEIVGYLGPNGSGKSTTVNMVVGLLEPSAGDLTLDGLRASQDPIAYKRRIGYVPEEPYLYAHLTAAEYLTLVGRLRDSAARSRRGSRSCSSCSSCTTAVTSR